MIRMDLRDCVLDGFGSIADRDVRQQVEVEGNAGELIQMIHRLRTNDFLCCGYNTQRNKACHVTGGRSNGSSTRPARAEIAAGAAADIEIVQVPRMRALVVLNFKNDLVLVVWFLD